MKQRKQKKTYIAIDRNSFDMVKVIVDLLLNSKTRMVTMDFTKKDGEFRTINGMLIRNVGKMSFNPFERGYIPVSENRYIRFPNGRCSTLFTQFRLVNLETVKRIAFDNKVINIGA